MGVVVLVCSLVSLTALGQPPNGPVEPPTPQQSSSPFTTDAPKEDSSRPVQDTSLQELQKTVDNLRHQVGALRELPNPTRVPMLLRNTDELYAYIVEQLEGDILEQVENEEQILKLLRVLDEDASYKSLALDLLTEQVAGYYEPDEQGLFLLADHLDEVDAAVIAHELQHAAQDHHWSLNALLRPPWHQSDVLSARSMLVEGDATLTMFHYAVGEIPPGMWRLLVKQMRAASTQQAEKLAERYPRFMVDSLIAPYTDGFVFAHALYEHGGWAAVNEAFEQLPLSSAQILYPDRYLLGEEPTFLHFELADIGVGARRHSDVWGMAGMRHLFAHMLPDASDDSIASATQGWRGDRLDLWEMGSQDMLVWVSVFESEAAAKSFYRLLQKLTPSLLSKDTPCIFGVHGQRCGAVDGSRGVLMEQWGDLALLLVAQDAHVDVSEALLVRTSEQVFRTLRRSKYPDVWR